MNNKETIKRRYISLDEAVEYLGIGKSMAQVFLNDIGAKRKIRKRTVYDIEIINKKMEGKDSA